MKRTKKCPKCDSLRIGHLAMQVDHNDYTVGEDVQGHPGVAMQPPSARPVGYRGDRINTGWLNYGEVFPLVGTLEAYVCTECGYHETYVKDPKSIEWPKLVGFSWVNPETASSGPFR